MIHDGLENIHNGVAKLAASVKENEDFTKSCNKVTVDALKEIPLSDQRKLKQEIKSLTKSLSEQTALVGALSRTLGLSIKNAQISNAKKSPSKTVAARLEHTDTQIEMILDLVKGLTSGDIEN